MPSSAGSHSTFFLLVVIAVLVLHARPAAAFGAGNIASISAVEGQNWRHGDIEDTLLGIFLARAAGGKKFTKLDVKRVYFGNWLRDYSQAVDVGAVKYVSAEAVRLILWVLGFMSFGYGTGAFEVTRDRLGCYRCEEHIDNPKDYADNIDARQYDPRLRGPVNERVELAVDTRTGLKHYIATEDVGITTSAGLVRNLYGRCIELGRRYARSNREEDLFEALRLMGTANHCLEDYTAHSNYTELALIELGERDVFPLVGRSTQLQLPGASWPVFPIVTGTFGGTDFLHSVMGEFSDKATQSEIQQLQGTIESSQNNQGDFSLLQDLLNQVPSGLFGGSDESGKVHELQVNAQAAQLQNTHITPKEPEAWARQLGEISKQIYPILEWHDNIMMKLNEAIEKIPLIPQLIEQLQEQVNVFVFSLLSPFVLPVINQVKNELSTGSSEIIQSSRDKQLNVFFDDYCTDPTHSMLSKDHFSNVLNEPAGKTASQILKWVVPQIMAAWDDERIDINRTLNRIVYGVFHHPALRQYGDDGAVDCRQGMFMIVQQWWQSKSEDEKYQLRQQLSRDGVQNGLNHKSGVHDSGHGSGAPLAMPNMKTAGSSGAIGGLAVGGMLGEIGAALKGQSKFDAGTSATGGSSSGGGGKGIGGIVAGGALGGIAGLAAGKIGADLLGDAFGGDGGSGDKQTYQSSYYNQDGSYTQSYGQTGYAAGGQVYGQADYSTTSYGGGGVATQEYSSYQESSTSFSDTTYQRTTETAVTSSGYEDDGYSQQTTTYSGGYGYGGDGGDGGDGGGDYGGDDGGRRFTETVTETTTYQREENESSSSSSSSDRGDDRREEVDTYTTTETVTESYGGDDGGDGGGDYGGGDGGYGGDNGGGDGGYEETDTYTYTEERRDYDY